MVERAIDKLPVELWTDIFDELLIGDFRLPLLPPSVPWSHRKLEFDCYARYYDVLRNRERLRLVAKKWNALVMMYPWRRPLPRRLDGLPPESHSGGVHWAVSPMDEGSRSGDHFEALVQSASTIAILELLWHTNSSFTKLYCIFAHASSFRRLRELILDLISSDQTCSNLAAHTFLSHINTFSSTLILFHLSVSSYNSDWFESPPVLRLANLLYLNLDYFGCPLRAFNISGWNCPKLTHLNLTGEIENTSYLTQLASIGSNLQFLSLQRTPRSKRLVNHNSYSLHFDDAFWRAFPLLETLRCDGGSGLSHLSPAHPIRELIVGHINNNHYLYREIVPLFQIFTASNDTTERKRRVILQDVNWSNPDYESFKRYLMDDFSTYVRIAPWLEDEEGVSL